MFKFSAVSQIWKKYIRKPNDWDLPLSVFDTQRLSFISILSNAIQFLTKYQGGYPKIGEW